MGLGSTVVVPVARPDSAAQLCRFAATIAAVDGGRVVPLSVVPPGAPAGAGSAARALVEAAAGAVEEVGVAAEGLVREGEEVAAAVLTATQELGATLIVIGWQGASTTRNVFGELIDSIVGRSTIPLAIVRAHPEPHRRVVLPVSEDHLLPGGRRGVRLAAELAGRLCPDEAGAVTVLRTGTVEHPLPAEVAALGDRIHHDRRRVDLAVGAAAKAGDLVVAPVAPTASGLRTATTHMAWAVPDAWLVVAVDVGPPPAPGEGIAAAVGDAGMRPEVPAPDAEADAEHVVQVTARLPAGAEVGALAAALRLVGEVGGLVDDGADADGCRRWHVDVRIAAPSANVALGAVLLAVHESEALEGAEVAYDIAGGSGRG